MCTIDTRYGCIASEIKRFWAGDGWTPPDGEKFFDDGSPGFFPIPQHKRACTHPAHDFPTHLHIPAGQGYRHRCPGCGATSVAYGSEVTL